MLGGLAGWLASMGMKRNDQMGCIAGAAVGGWVLSFFGGTGVTGFNLHSLLVVVNLIFGGK